VLCREQTGSGASVLGRRVAGGLAFNVLQVAPAASSSRWGCDLIAFCRTIPNTNGFLALGRAAGAGVSTAGELSSGPQGRFQGVPHIRRPAQRRPRLGLRRVYVTELTAKFLALPYSSDMLSGALAACRAIVAPASAGSAGRRAHGERRCFGDRSTDGRRGVGPDGPLGRRV